MRKVTYLNLPYSLRKYFSHLKRYKPTKLLQFGSQCIANLSNNFTSLWCRYLRQNEAIIREETMKTFDLLAVFDWKVQYYVILENKNRKLLVNGTLRGRLVALNSLASISSRHHSKLACLQHNPEQKLLKPQQLSELTREMIITSSTF